jgi:hypothetical protein
MNPKSNTLNILQLIVSLIVSTHILCIEINSPYTNIKYKSVKVSIDFTMNDLELSLGQREVFFWKTQDSYTFSGINIEPIKWETYGLKLHWESSNTNVVNSDTLGIVKAIGIGSAILRVRLVFEDSILSKDSININVTWNCPLNLHYNNVNWKFSYDQPANIIYAKADYFNGGIFRSNDKGLTWNRTGPNIKADSSITYSKVDICPSQSGRIVFSYKSRNYDSGFCVSDDGGSVWKRGTGYKQMIIYSNDDKNVLYGISAPSFYKLDGANSNWQLLSTEYPIYYSCILCRDPSSANKLFISSYTSIVSTDNGKTWNQIQYNDSTDKTIQILHVDNLGRIYASKTVHDYFPTMSHDNLLRSNDNCVTWDT